MLVVDTTARLRSAVSDWRRRNKRVAFVPTMGNLHAGHLALVREALTRADRAVVSIFVNPLQFGAGEDFSTYPRTLRNDSQQLAKLSPDLLFVPNVKEMYPRPLTETTQVEVPGLSDILCGESRPGHFVGVTTVVAKLLNMVQPDVAVFGEKDYQQLLLIRRMVEDLVMPIEIAGMATVREADGLAMSSRNQYLSADERRLAPALYAELRRIMERIRSGEGGFAMLESDAMESLRDAGFVPEYVSVRRQLDLDVAGEGDDQVVVLAAARLGPARLIDNLKFSLK